MSPTNNLSLVLLKLDVAVRLDEDLDEHNAMLVPAADAFHEARIADTLLVLHVLKLRNIYTRRSRGGGREREALAHGGGCWGVGGWWEEGPSAAVGAGRSVAPGAEGLAAIVGACENQTSFWNDMRAMALGGDGSVSVRPKRSYAVVVRMRLVGGSARGRHLELLSLQKGAPRVGCLKSRA